MKKTLKDPALQLAFIALCATIAALCGCQTRVTIESDATTPLPIQKLVEENGTNRSLNLSLNSFVFINFSLYKLSILFS